MEKKRFNVMQSADSNSKVGIWYVNNVSASEINEAVYAVFCVVAQAVLDRSTCFISGDRTAAELAGSLGSRWCPAVMTLTAEHNTMADETCIKVGGNTYERDGVLYMCQFKTDKVFEQMAEWEGVMSLAPKKYHRFACECKQESFSREPLKPYTRCHGYKPKTVSLAAENDRIAKKFEVIGPMYEVLGSEGMKRALSVLTAAKSIEKLYGYQMGELAERLLRRKLWREYGTCEPMKRRVEWLKSEAARMKQNGEEKSERAKKMNEEFKSLQQKIMLHMERYYTAKDFEAAPECWKVVDEDYAKELMGYFRKVLADSPAPKWPAKGDMVMLKNQERQPKKWQGKLSVYEVRGSLDIYQDKINWYAVVCTTKGKHDSMNRDVCYLEPWTEPEKPASKRGKNDACIGSSERKQARPEVKSKKKAVSKKEKTTAKAINPEPCTVNPEPTLEERLRAALLKQLAMAA